MKLFAPEYYKRFKCIADKCRHSCCVGWEIDVDPATLKKYGELPEESRREILDTVELEGGAPHFRLSENERCPHLSETGLCNIITQHGEHLLCDICREHPRFYNLSKDRVELGIGAVCEVAAGLILSSENYADMLPVGDICGDGELCEFDFSSERDAVYKILSERGLPYGERLEKIEKSYTLPPRDGELAREIFSSLEYLREEDRALFLSAVSGKPCDIKNETESERALAYFIYRHCGEADSESDFCVSLSLSLLLHSLFCALCARCGIGGEEALRLISEEIEYSEDNIEEIRLSLI